MKEETEKLARELLEIYAKREIAARPYYLSDTEIDVALTDTFPYEETPDQIQAIEDIKKELETSQIPLDRIVNIQILEKYKEKRNVTFGG